jgi:Domain of unknown function (DUF4232)
MPAAALTLAACGGSATTTRQNTPTTTASVQTAPSATSPAAPPATTPTTTAVQTTPAAPSPSICRAADLSGSFLGGQAATGHGLLGFALQNRSDHMCTTYGFPGIQFLSRSGQPLTTVPTHTTQDFFGSLPEPALTVSPGATVSFRLGVTHGAASTTGCATAYGLQVIPPNDTSTLHIALPNGAYECQTATVSPMQQGTSAYP